MCTLHLDAGSLYQVTVPTMETLLTSILTSLYLPAPGLLSRELSLGVGDRLSVRAPLDASIPVTGTCVAMLYRQVGRLVSALA